MVYQLVYQYALANVFRKDNPQQRGHRVLLHTFEACEWFLQGVHYATGCAIDVFHCDEKGDCQNMDWEDGPGELFSSNKNPPPFTIRQPKTEQRK